MTTSSLLERGRGNDGQEISSPNIPKYRPYIYVFLVWLPLGWKLYYGPTHTDLYFLLPVAACFLILLLSGAANKYIPGQAGVGGGKSKASVTKSFSMTLYIRSCFERPIEYKENNKPVKLWKKFVSNCYEDRIVHSVRDFGIALVAACMLSEKAGPGSQICSWEDCATGLVVIAGILTTCIASVSYEIELHEKRASMDTGYYRPTCFEKLLLYIIQLSRLLWILHFLASIHALHPWIGGPIWIPIVFFAFNIILHKLTKCCRLSNIPTYPKFENMPEVLRPEHFLFPTPTSLACSLADHDSIFWKQLVLVMKDVVPMIAGQVLMSLWLCTDDDRFRGLVPYYCRIGIVEYEVPLPFTRDDWLGIVILGIYAGVLVVYWIYAQASVVRKEAVVSDGLKDPIKGKKKQ